MRFNWKSWKTQGCPICLRFVLLVIVSVAFVPLTKSAEDSQKMELQQDEFEAVCLSKIPAYVHWPKRTLPRDGEKFTFGLVGKDSFNGLLQKLVEGKSAHGRALAVRIVERPEDLDNCQLIFVPADKYDLWQKLSKDRELFGILTIGENEAFTKHGGAFRLVLEQRKLAINRKNAAKAGLEINSKLLKISLVEK